MPEHILFQFQLTFISSIDSVNGSIGFDNILFTSQKKCLPKWISLDGYKFHQDITTDDFYKSMFQPRYLKFKCVVMVELKSVVFLLSAHSEKIKLTLINLKIFCQKLVDFKKFHVPRLVRVNFISQIKIL